MTGEALQAFVRTHWPTGRFSIVVAGEARLFVEGLRQHHPALVVIPRATVDLERADLQRGGGPPNGR